MKNIRSKSGPFAERPVFKLREIEEICTTELKASNLYPSSPQPIRIDRFIEKRFGPFLYEKLPEGVLGFTRFGPKGVHAIVVSRDLDNGDSTVLERRLRSTLAHEGGHGLLHAHLFLAQEQYKSLFDHTEQTPRILCRDVPDGPKVTRGYDGRWWEFQANKAIGGLLMPRALVEFALREFCVETGGLGQRILPPENREVAARALSDVFDVNAVVARLRIEDIFSSKNDAQLHL